MSVGWTKQKKKPLDIWDPAVRFHKMRGTYNFYTRKSIVLEEGEVLCNKCHGEGVVWRVTKKTILGSETGECEKCLGYGKLDWLENMMGGRKDDGSRLKFSW